MANDKTKKPEPNLIEEIDKSVKMFDVAKPGQTPAQATSRPIIVKHGAMLKKDPMVREEKPSEEIKPIEHGETVIAPIAEEPNKPNEPVELEAVVESDVPKVPEKKPIEKPPEPAEEEKKAKPDDKPAEDQPEPAQDEEEPGETLANEKARAKTEDQKEQDEIAAKTKEAQNSIQSKEFFVHTGKVSRRFKNRLLLLAIFVIIAGAAFLNLAVDAEIIEIGLEPLTNLL